MSPITRWQDHVHMLKQQTYALYLAYRQPDVPWYARVWAAVVVAYALSPIDLIPDFIPVLGYLDDLLLVPLGIWLAIRLIPAPIWARCRQQAESTLSGAGATGRIAAVVIVAIWVGVIILIGWMVLGSR